MTGYAQQVDVDSVGFPVTFTPVEVSGPIDQPGLGFNIFGGEDGPFLGVIVHTPAGVGVVRIDPEYVGQFYQMCVAGISQLAQAKAKFKETGSTAGHPLATVQ